MTRDLGTNKNPIISVMPPIMTSISPLRATLEKGNLPRRTEGRTTRTANVCNRASSGKLRTGVSVRRPWRIIYKSTDSNKIPLRNSQKRLFRSCMILFIFFARILKTNCESGETADAPDLGSGGGNSVRVQLPPLAPRCSHIWL